MAGLRRGYVDGPFGQIHLRTGGADTGRRPLYGLHQSPKSGQELEPMLRAAGASRPVVAPDYPGYGASDPPPDAAAATIPAYAEAVWAVADALGHARIDLFGNHTGACVALEMARQRPARVGALALVSALVLTAAEQAAFEAYFQPIPLDEAGTRLTTMWARIGASVGPGVSLEMRLRSLTLNLLGGEGYEWGHAAAFAYAPAVTAVLAALDLPILVFNPADELAEATRRAAPLLQRGRVEERPAWRHGFLELAAAEVAAETCAFLDAAEMG